MSKLIEDSQKHIENCMRELSGDDDFMPFLALTTGKGDRVFAALMLPAQADQREELCDSISALCLASRATEAVFASVCWMVMVETKEEALSDDLIPSEHPDRVEVITLSTVTAGGPGQIISANVIRENNMIGVGMWEVMDDAEAQGRYIDAMRLGLGLASKVPAAFTGLIDGILKEEPESMVKALNAISQKIGALRKQKQSSFNN